MQGRTRASRNATLYSCTLQLQLALTPEDFNQQHDTLVEKLSRLYGEPVGLQLQAGSVIVDVIAEVTDPLALAAFQERARALSDTALSDELQVEVNISTSLTVTNRSIAVPADVICPVGFYCSAAASYSCPRGTWNNLTGQDDSSKCRPCPDPERMTTLYEGTASVEDCVCLASYYKASNGSCLVCPVGTECSEAGVSISTLPVIAGYFRASNTSIDVRRCPDAGENCGGRDDCDESSSGCRGNVSQPCEPSLAGIMCQLCQDDDHYYVPASGESRAHCSECGGTFETTLGVVLAIVVGAIFLVTALERGYHRLSLDARLALKGAHKKLRLDVKLKIIVGFYMIATQVGDVYEVRLPQDIQQLFIVMTGIVSLGLNARSIQTTPLACLGLPGYVPQLLFWTLAPLILVALILLATFVRLTFRPQKPARSSEAVLLEAAPLVLRLLFLVYPIVTQEAFKAFPCYTFDAGTTTSARWLRADVSIECGTDAHDAAWLLALLAIMLYPVGLFALFARLLYLARAGITSGRPTRLSAALAFLHREFETRFFWWGAHARL